MEEKISEIFGGILCITFAICLLSYLCLDIYKNITAIIKDNHQSDIKVYEYTAGKNPVTLKYKYKNNYVQYNITGKGNFTNYDNLLSRIQLYFVDDDGFEIKEQEILFRRECTMNDKSFECTGNFPISKDKYNSIKDVRLNLYHSLF